MRPSGDHVDLVRVARCLTRLHAQQRCRRAAELVHKRAVLLDLVPQSRCLLALQHLHAQHLLPRAVVAEDHPHDVLEPRLAVGHRESDALAARRITQEHLLQRGAVHTGGQILHERTLVHVQRIEVVRLSQHLLHREPQLLRLVRLDDRLCPAPHEHDEEARAGPRQRQRGKQLGGLHLVLALELDGRRHVDASLG
jgi:hypothetical protein